MRIWTCKLKTTYKHNLKHWNINNILTWQNITIRVDDEIGYQSENLSYFLITMKVWNLKTLFSIFNWVSQYIAIDILLNE